MKLSLKILAVTSFLALLLNGCQPVSTPTGTGNAASALAAAITQITIHAHDFSYDAPAQIEAGWVEITLENDGVEPHHAQLVRLNDGVTAEQFLAALKEGEGPAVALVGFTGGPGVIDQAGQQKVTVEVTPGNYFLLCFVPSADGVPHLAKGMVMPFEVVARANSEAQTKPASDGVVKLLDFSFILPDVIAAGQQVWEVVNEGQEGHEIALIKLAEGKTLDDVAAFMQQPNGPPPWSNAGGFQAIAPGATGYMQLKLSAGEYVALCHVPSPANQGKRHEELGMVRPFTVK